MGAVTEKPSDAAVSGGFFCWEVGGVKILVSVVGFHPRFAKINGIRDS